MSRRLMLRNASGGGILPPEYQQVEYIFTNSSQRNAYIATSYTPQVSDEIYIEFSPYRMDQYCLYSAGNGTYQFVVIICGGGGKSYVRTFATSALEGVLFYTDSEKLCLHSYLDGNAYKTIFQNLTRNTQRTYSNSSIANLDGNDTNFYLFRRRNNATYYDGSISKFWAKDSNGNFVANYVPCYRKNDGVIGMYDTVSNAFFTSANSGTFTKGADVN